MAHLSRIAPEIPVSDLREAIQYYEQKLGFKVVAQMPAGDYAVVERDDVAIHLFADEPGDIRLLVSMFSRTDWTNCRPSSSSAAPSCRRR